MFLTAIYPRFTHESGTIRKKQAIDVSKLKRLLCYESQHQSQSNEKSLVQFDYEKAVSNYLGTQSTFNSDTFCGSIPLLNLGLTLGNAPNQDLSFLSFLQAVSFAVSQLTHTSPLGRTLGVTAGLLDMDNTAAVKAVVTQVTILCFAPERRLSLSIYLSIYSILFHSILYR